MPLNKHNSIVYFGNDNPICPYCDMEINIEENGLAELYAEDSHEFECPFCEKEICVRSRVKWSFDTTDQE